MPDDYLSPEEKLFKVIQEEKKTSIGKNAGKETIGAKPPKASWAEGAAKFFSKGVLSAGKIFGGFTAAKNKDQKEPPLFASPVRLKGIDSVKQLLSNGLELEAVNRTFIGILLVLTTLVVHQVFYKKSDMKTLMDSISKIKFETPAGLGSIEAFQPVDHYLQQVRQRDIFNLITKVEKMVIVEEPPPPPPPPPPQPKLKDLAQGFKVVGIAWGANPKVMIKDNKTQEIFFLKEGETVGKTAIQVKTIQRDKIILGYEDEEMDLF